MTYTFQQVFGVVKTHATERLVEYDEEVPNEGSYNTIIENAMMRLFDNIQEEVRDYNELMNDAEPNLTLELITIEELE